MKNRMVRIVVTLMLASATLVTGFLYRLKEQQLDTTRHQLNHVREELALERQFSRDLDGKLRVYEAAEKAAGSHRIEGTSIIETVDR